MVGFGIPGVGAAVERVLATAQNGLEVLRFGSLDTGIDPTPFIVAENEPMFRLRRYFPDDPGTGPHVLLIPPLMVAANVYDVTETNGAVSILHQHGIIPWVIDFGSPDAEEGGLERTLADHVLAVNRAIDIVVETAGRDIHLSGYSQGGMFAYQAASYRQSKNIKSITSYGSPVDVLGGLPMHVPASIAAPVSEFLADNVVNRLWIPGWMSRTGFQMLDPVKTIKGRIDFLRKLHDRDALLPREEARRFLEVDGWVAWSGPAIAELLRQFVAHNRMMSGGFVIDGVLVSLTELTMPILAFVGTADDIGQPVAVRGIVRAASRAEVYESTMPVGHFGLVVGSAAGAHSWPTTAEWINWHEGIGPRPEVIEKMAEVPEGGQGSGVSLSSRLTHGFGSVAMAGANLTKDIADAAGSLQRTTVAVARESVRSVPMMLSRMGQIQADTQISLGKLMSENTKRGGDKELFLFENRVLTHRQVNTRINNVVAGLIHCGIRPGTPIGVLMETRPSALVVVAALSRLGAVAVMLSPDADLGEMLRVTHCAAVVTDPDNLEAARSGCDHVLVLGGGSGQSRRIAGADGTSVVDMEQIEPSAVEIPKWYRPDPGVAGDVAFILFTRSGGKLNPWRVTNHRFAMSAFGAASAAALTDRDTVYCLPPLHHASGLLTTIGAAVAGRSRIALSNAIEPETFAAEIDRYGVTVVSYTWSMLREVIRADDLQINRYNPIRLFMGSGMPGGLWNDVTDTFPRARVLEFFATADGSVILANVAGDKPGAMGQSLPGTNHVELAAWDVANDRLIIDDSGFVRKADAGMPGLLLSRATHRFDTNGTVLRGVFAPGDRWEVVPQLFVRDVDNDLWLVSALDRVIHSADGPLFSPPVEYHLSQVDGVDQVAAYPVGEAGSQIMVAALTLRTGASADSLTVTALRLALGEVPAALRPHLICVVDEIPVSSSYRPLAAALAANGIPEPGLKVWYRDDEGRYRRYTKNIAAEIDWSHRTLQRRDQPSVSR
ncbi:AMP-binding protein [Gordonia sp. (in: high G+C Gram-positive bacteria)]|jgi:putative long chain acyl-CoA synthase|uniref:AMP-binding protein n=1 Tax=Gordonia sp. (in: high G+C Gram-positive bacteria) TaxID=84139 RepID=UPI001DE0797A|nr:AMP-binding protein [Gordonia sp. (in: high G+C Gram-positive bacteria)]MCB1294553.1 AMP-binding protein [Gordonia sp. (in: high G+C Gram-positive bacteria)]HMS73919.1 AMP-binding protein [Gordonia sp. (in: high G+C Gram-positive bacteria)]HQV17842.1 AMP-binding protein [Gordonia sp. (in: high G+C Gram-positive bacteria)]